MSEDSMLMCLICFVLGFIVSRMMRGNGLSVGGDVPRVNCSGRLPMTENGDSTGSTTVSCRKGSTWWSPCDKLYHLVSTEPGKVVKKACKERRGLAQGCDDGDYCYGSAIL